jgi:hypothetical protein
MVNDYKCLCSNGRVAFAAGGIDQNADACGCLTDEDVMFRCLKLNLRHPFAI